MTMTDIPSKYFPQFKKDLPNVHGKVFVITGTTSGTGFVAAQTVAEKGGHVVMLNRPSPRVQEALTRLRTAVPHGKFSIVECDLQNFASVKRAAQEVKAKYSVIYCLCNNAGIIFNEDEATVDGCDIQIQTNHLSHFLLTKELFPLLEAYATTVTTKEVSPCVVFHSSAARSMTKKGLEQRYFEKNGGNLGGNSNSLFFGGARMIRYAQSKLANSVMMHALHNKLQARNEKNNTTNNSNTIRAIACHPGACPTNIGKDMQLPCFEDLLMRHVVGKCLVQSVEDGTMGLLRAMMDPTAQSGVLYGPAGGGSSMSGPPVPNPPTSHETDIAAQNMLWETSEATTGVAFTI